MPNGDNKLIRFGRFRIDVAKKLLWLNEEVCDVPVKSVELLSQLVKNAGEVISKEDLLSNVWQDSFVEESVLPQNVYFLRKLFREHGVEEGLIQTIPRRGYRFVGELVDVDDEVVIERETIESTFITESDISSHEFVNGVLTSDEAVDRSITRRMNAQIEPGGVVSFRPRVSRILLIVSLGILVCTVGLLVAYTNLNGRGAAADPAPRNNGVSYESLSESGRVVSVGLSPDDQNAVFVVNTADNKYEMILQHLPTKSETVIIHDQDAFLANIRFSPDGSYIYYLGSDVSDKLTAFKMPLYGGVSQPVLQDLVNYFTVSPDGEWLAFFRQGSKDGAQYLEVARSRDGSDRRTVAIRKNGEAFRIWGTAPSWSPDGKKLITAALAPGRNGKRFRNILLEIDIADGKQSVVRTPEGWTGIHEPYYSRTGDSVYLKVREGVGVPVQIRQISLSTGEVRNITNDTNDYREFRVSSDESFLITAVWSRSENLFLLSTEQPEQLRQLTFDTEGQNGAQGLAWTVDGKVLLFTKNRGFGVGNIWRMDIETGRSRQITNEDNSEQFEIDVTPDGRSMVYSSTNSGSPQIWRQDLDGSNRRRLTNGRNVHFSEVSTDGSWIYYADNGFWKIPVDGGDAIKLMETTPGRVHFSPIDPGMFAAYVYDDSSDDETPYKHVLVNLNDTENFKDLGLAGIGGRSDWAQDGGKIYYIGTGENFNNIWTVSPYTLDQKQLTNFQDQRIANASLSPNGKQLAISRGIAIGRILKINLF